jgi:hypothetical protein
MSGRIAGGLAGWIAGVLLLVAVNVADFVGIFSFDEAVLAGTIALLAGTVLGGVVAGIIGGRPRAGQPGGAAAAFPSGIVAALLFGTSVLALKITSGIRDSAYNLSAQEWLRYAVTIVFFSALLLGVALLAGALAGRRSAAGTMPTASSAYRQSAPSSPRPGDSRPARRYPQSTDPRRQLGYGERPDVAAGWHADSPYRPDDRYTPAARGTGPRSGPARGPSGQSRPR